MASANQNGIKDGRLLLPVCLCDHIPLARGGEIGAFSYAEHACLEEKQTQPFTLAGLYFVHRLLLKQVGGES